MALILLSLASAVRPSAISAPAQGRGGGDIPGRPLPAVCAAEPGSDSGAGCLALEAVDLVG